jgi:hypothetical protein
MYLNHLFDSRGKSERIQTLTIYVILPMSTLLIDLIEEDVD